MFFVEIHGTKMARKKNFVIEPNARKNVAFGRGESFHLRGFLKEFDTPFYQTERENKKKEPATV